MQAKREYQICTRCVMDTTDPDIVFDAKGHCNHCTAALERQELVKNRKVSQSEFNNVIATIKEKGKGKKYDCLIGVSGGVDSCYTAYLAVQNGLRPLLVHMDNGWNSEIAVKNIMNLVQKLGVDYESYVIDWREFREVQLAFLKASSVDLEIPTDIGILASVFETAAKYDIPTVISGGNDSAEGILPLTWGYHVMHDMKLYKHIVSKYSDVKLDKVPHVSIPKQVYYRFIKKIKTIYLLNYIDFNKDKAREFLKANYGWQDYGGKHHESKITAFWQSFVMPTKFNMDYRRATLSSQIVSGQITRDEALEKLKPLPYDPATVAEQKAYIAKKYNISSAEMEEYLALPPKTYKDFPNNKEQNERLFNLYRKFFKKKS